MVYTQEGVIKDSRPWAKIFAAGAAAVALSIAMFASTFAASSDLKCFSGTTDGGYNGTCSVVSGVATIDTTDGDLDPYNNYAGVYYDNTSLSGQLVGNVNALSFHYEGSGTVGGSPRFSVPVDSNNDGVTDSDYVFVDAVGCTDGNLTSGNVNPVTDATCSVTYKGTTYDNWATFVAANPALKIATDSVPFVIVDQPGDFTISNVVIGAQTETLTKEACKSNGWKTAKTADGKSFKNQGACVSYVQANSNASFKRQ